MGDFSDDYGGYDILGLYEQREDERIAQRAKLLTLPKQTGMIHIDRLEQWLDASLKERKQREWVGLTDEMIQTALSQIYCDINQMKFASDDRPQKETVGFLFARALEAMLKELNT